MSSKTEIVARRASYRKVFSARFLGKSFSTATPHFTHNPPARGSDRYGLFTTRSRLAALQGCCFVFSSRRNATASCLCRARSEAVWPHLFRSSMRAPFASRALILHEHSYVAMRGVVPSLDFAFTSAPALRSMLIAVVLSQSDIMANFSARFRSGSEYFLVLRSLESAITSPIYAAWVRSSPGL
jgi:hypothetical protein